MASNLSNSHTRKALTMICQTLVRNLNLTLCDIGFRNIPSGERRLYVDFEDQLSFKVFGTVFIDASRQGVVRLRWYDGDEHYCGMSIFSEKHYSIYENHFSAAELAVRDSVIAMAKKEGEFLIRKHK